MKIMTAINNPILNEELKNENDIQIICKDIQYKEGILEILENNINVDYIIIDEKLPGEIELEKLIDEILEQNERIKIIITIKKENKNKINFNNEKIIKIFYDDKINLNKLKNYKINLEKNNFKKDNIINNKKNSLKKDNIINDKINNEKNEINNKNNIIKINRKNNEKEIDNFKIINKFEKINLNRYKNKLPKSKEIEKVIKDNKTITILGEEKVGKSMTIINFAYYLKSKNCKILLVELNEENPSFYTIFGCKKFNAKFIKNRFKLKNSYKKLTGKFLLQYMNEKIIKDMIIKIDKNLFLISYNKLINYNLLKKLEKYFNYLLIEIYSRKNKKKINKILINSDENLLLINPNLLGVKNGKKIIEKNNINNYNKSKIILNNCNKYSINEKIMENIFKESKIIGKINYKMEYEELINKNFKSSILDFKSSNNEISKIVNKIF